VADGTLELRTAVAGAGELTADETGGAGAAGLLGAAGAGTRGPTHIDCEAATLGADGNCTGWPTAVGLGTGRIRSVIMNVLDAGVELDLGKERVMSWAN